MVMEEEEEEEEEEEDAIVVVRVPGGNGGEPATGEGPATTRESGRVRREEPPQEPPLEATPCVCYTRGGTRTLARTLVGPPARRQNGRAERG